MVTVPLHSNYSEYSFQLTGVLEIGNVSYFTASHNFSVEVTEIRDEVIIKSDAFCSEHCFVTQSEPNVFVRPTVMVASGTQARDLRVDSHFNKTKTLRLWVA